MYNEIILKYIYHKTDILRVTHHHHHRTCLRSVSTKCLTAFFVRGCVYVLVFGFPEYGLLFLALQGVSVKHPRMFCVCKSMRQPLRLQ